MKLVIIDYGAGNIKSLQFAFKRLGVDAVLSSNIAAIQEADKIIFPGVGEASTAMKMLCESGIDKVIPRLKQPVLGICLGMQLLCNATEENNTSGLGVFDVTVKRFSNKVKVPQIGWNTIEDLKTPLFKGIEKGVYMYSVHSYYATHNQTSIAKSFYEVNYAAALAKDNFYGVQFHPEKSSQAGARLLKNFLEL